MGWKIRGSNPGGSKELLSKPSKPALGKTQYAIQLLIRVI
jgi:hypothetical protein